MPVRDACARVLSVALFAVLAARAPREAAAQRATVRRVDVYLTDSASRRPVARARVTSRGSAGNPVLSDSTGRATLRVSDPESTVIRVSADGFRAQERPLALRGADFLSVEIVLSPAVTMLPGYQVAAEGDAGSLARTGRLADFERRVSTGRGRYIVQQEIERRGSVRTTELFRGIAGLRVADSGYAKLIVATRSAQLSLVSKSAHKECVVPIVVDGLLREGSFQVDLIDPKEIHGIEIYVGVGTIPPEFSSMRQNAWCGLIVIWTRAR